MSRYFMIQSWVGSHENEPDYNGQQCGERSVRSIEAVPLYDQFGNANVSAFSDEAIAARNAVNKPVSKVSIKDKILPQAKRLTTLREQMLELEQSYRAGEMSITDYSLYRDVIVAKIERQEVLLKKAASLRPNREETDEVEAETIYSSYDVDYTDTPTTPSNWLDDFIAELPVTNFFRNPLKTALQVTRKAVEFSQKARNYINELKAV